MKNVYSLFLFFMILSCRAQTGTAVSSASAGPDEFEKGFSTSGAQVLDVRTPGEFKSGHLKNAMHADWNNPEEFKQRLQYVDKNRPVFVYCLAGGRSAAAAAWLKEKGFTQVINLTGGINAWKNAGKPVEGQSDEPQMTMEQYLSSIPADRTILVDFGASWCPPCIKMNPVLDELSKDPSLDFTLVKIDGGVHTSLMNQLGLEPIPVFIIYKNGKETWRKQGIVSRETLITELKH